METKGRNPESLPYSTILQKNCSLELLKSMAYTGSYPTMHSERMTLRQQGGLKGTEPFLDY